MFQSFGHPSFGEVLVAEIDKTTLVQKHENDKTYKTNIRKIFHGLSEKFCMRVDLL